MSVRCCAGAQGSAPLLRYFTLAGPTVQNANNLARQGILSPDTRKGLTKLVIYLFIPAFIFVKLAPSITIAKLVAWWPLPVNMALR